MASLGARLPEGWDYDASRRPPRAQVAGIEPLGLGTALVEALTSYVARLATAHDLPPGLFARHVLAPALGRGDAEGASRDDWGKYFAAIFSLVLGSLDGAGRHAATWVDALARLTLRGDLRLLTLLPWSVVLADGGLTRPERRVCPVCLKQQRAAGVGPYEPLLWRVAPLRTCCEHERPILLESVCRACGKVSGVLGTWSMPGRCSCGAWRGVDEGQARHAPEEEASWQRYVYGNLAEMIVVGQRRGAPTPGRQDLQQGVTLAVARSDGSLTALASATGYSLSAVSLWHAGRRVPTLDAALRMCAASGLPLVAVLTGKGSEPDFAPGTSQPLPPARPIRARIDWAAAEHVLRAALAADTPPALATVLRDLGIDRSLARAHLPELSAAVRDRHAAWRRAQMQARRKRDAGLVRAAVRDLWRAGHHPSIWRLQRALPPGVSMREPRLRLVWKSELRELGLL